MGDRIDIVYGGISVLRGLEHDDLAEELLRREVEDENEEELVAALFGSGEGDGPE